MNQVNPISVNKLRAAMARAEAAASIEDLEEAVQAAQEIGRQAVQVALTEPPQPVVNEEQRQRDLDAAFADAIEVVKRARERNGRRVTSTHDGSTTRKVFELLRSVMGADGGSDNDPAFQ